MKTVLIAEDEYAIAMALEFILSAEGYRVLLASNGKVALERMAQNPPDLLILDIMMPGMSGIEAYEEIRKNPNWKNLPVIFMSAGQPPAILGKFSSFISKPFNLETMIVAVRDAIGPAK